MPDKMPDVIVLLPGIIGSELKKEGHVIWGWSGRVLAKNLLTLGNDYVANLLVKQDSPVDEFLDDKVVASRLLPDLHMLPGVWKIDGYGAVADFIKSEFRVVENENFFPFPYDWRRDNRSSAHSLKKRTDDWLHQWRAKSGNPNAKLILIAHSMGGLVSRYFLEVLEGWRTTRALITFGTPFRGSLNAVDAIANGMKPLGIINLSRLARGLNSLYQLLPTYECIDWGSGTLRRVVDGRLPNADLARIKDAFEFHEEIRRAVEAHQQDEVYRKHTYRVYPIVGYRQPTNQSGRILGDRVELLHEIRGTDFAGDGTVPRPSATPLEQEDAAMGMFAATKHSSLQNADAVLTHLGGVLSGLNLPLGDFRAANVRLVQLSLDLADLSRTDEPIIVRARPSQAGVALGATFVDVESGQEMERLPMTASRDGWHSVKLMLPKAGAYRVNVSGIQAGVEPAADAFEVIEPE
jgi:pimeloyl-ACP methyl ester carboxylesterase